jgi:hypothetical protein
MLSLAFACLISYQPPAASVSIPKTINAVAGDLVKVDAESGSELVSWDGSDGLSITYPKNSNSKSVFIHSAVAKDFALVASIPDGKETKVSICLVHFGPKVPPGPPPAPGFQDKLQAAYERDGKPADKTALLAAIYKKAADTTVYDAGITSVGALMNEVATAAGSSVGDAKKVLPETRQLIAGELPGLFGATAPFDKAARDRASAAFKSVASSLENLK